MRCALKLLPLLVLCGLASLVVGCGGAKSGGSAESGGGGVGKSDGGKAAKSTQAASPARQFKPTSQLKTPEGIAADAITEIKVHKSVWPSWSTWSPGDVWTTETTNEGKAISRSRIEIFDVADHAIMTVLDTTVFVGDNESKSKSAIKYVFTETDASSATPDAKDTKVKQEKKPDTRKFQVGGKEYTADTRTDNYSDGKLTSRMWSSKELPEMVTLLTEVGDDGKITMRLIEYSRKGK